MNATTDAAPAMRWRVHHVVAELDARGEIDEHAAICLRCAIDGAQPSTTELVLVDLRDLTAIDDAGLRLFATRNADCNARGMEMGLLISGHERHDEIHEAFVLAGLGDALHHTSNARVPAAAQPAGPHDRAQGMRTRRFAQAARRVSSRRPRRASTS
jgi:anti-anti-sigma factor